MNNIELDKYITLAAIILSIAMGYAMGINQITPVDMGQMTCTFGRFCMIIIVNTLRRKKMDDFTTTYVPTTEEKLARIEEEIKDIKAAYNLLLFTVGFLVLMIFPLAFATLYHIN